MEKMNMNRRSPRFLDRPSSSRGPRSLRRPRSLLLVIAAAMLLVVGVASAGATSSIEGVWSFNGGQIAVEPSSNGMFIGTVVAETKFAECTHPVGQPIWTEMTPQPDGSYWGLHQWYYESSSCSLNPTLGKTAWRVLEAANGSHYLRVCFSSPGTTQPSIAANGTPNGRSEYAAYGVTYECQNSALLAALPQPTSLNQAVVLPPAKTCTKLSSLKIKLKDPKFDPLREVVIRLKGKKVAYVRGTKKLKKVIVLKGLPTGVYTLKITATTVLNRKLSGSRTYHSCVKKLPSSSNVKLQGPKSHHKG